ncbi:carboxy terminal-processing peptidase, partial [Escherichia coli]
ELWRKRVKDEVLRLKIAGKETNDIQELLTKRYKNQLARLKQTRGEDVFQAYINAFATTYDPHTTYLSPDNAENFDINMSLSLEGIGAVLQSDNE